MSNRDSPIMPTMGRIVLVRGPLIEGDHPEHEYPAIITSVRDRNFINVHALNERLGGRVVSSVAYNDDFSVRETRAGWRWPDQTTKESQAPHSVRDRVQIEADELRKRTLALGDFRMTDMFLNLSNERRGLLEAQLKAMMTYLDILDRRLALMSKEA